MKPALLTIWTRLLLVAFAAFGNTQGASLAVRNGAFTVNGKATFLLGISYYGALGAREGFWPEDLADMQHYGFNWLRVWATWNSSTNDLSAVDSDGQARQPFLDRLRQLV